MEKTTSFLAINSFIKNELFFFHSHLRILLLFTFCILSFNLGAIERDIGSDNINKDVADVAICITSDESVLASGEETVFVSLLVNNNSDEVIKDILSLDVPDDWIVVPNAEIQIEVPPRDSVFQIFGVKIPADVIAGTHTLYAHIEELAVESQPIAVEIPATVQLKAVVENIAPYYLHTNLINLDLNILNEGNAPVNVRIEARGDPICQVKFDPSPILIPPGDYRVNTIKVTPHFSPQDNQFIIYRVINDETCEVMYQNTIAIRLTAPDDDDEDPCIRIPGYISTIAYNDEGDWGFALEMAGEGIIDAERERYLEYYFFLPTTNNNNYWYNSVNEEVYIGISEPEWSIDLGDTIYTLTPLTQLNRYGRGAGFDIDLDDFACGAHYTQNAYNNCYNPMETCGYVGYYPTENLYVSGNYLHRYLEDYPKSDIISIASEYLHPGRGATEVEIANNFANNEGRHDTYAFRFDTQGQVYQDTWFDVEGIYAGRDFWGYYNDLKLISGVVDFPICCPLRANASVTMFRQVYEQGDYDCDDFYILKQRQNQCNVNISYNCFDNLSLTLNGLLLRAWDEGECPDYNFYQQWGGLTASTNLRGWNLTGNISFGRQTDYLRCHTESFLQAYWLYASRQLRENFYGSLFYQGGNTNYYDARHWRNCYGGSLRYQYAPYGFAELYFQRVQNSPDRYQYNQASFLLSHTFSNRHVLDISAQYYHYQCRFANDYYFLVSYTVPFSLPMGTRRDIGNVEGYVQDARNGYPVADAMLDIGGRKCITDSQGYFAANSLKRGMHDLNIEMLPKQYVTLNERNPPIAVLGGKNRQIVIPVTTNCSIEGEVVLYDYADPLEILLNPDKLEDKSMMKKKPVSDIRVVIDRNNGEDAYTCLTNTRGAFKFTNLRPGDWCITISTEAIPEYHRLNMNQITYEIKADENKQIQFEILPIPPKVQSL